MKFRLSAAAQSDLDDCWSYIAQDNIQAAERFLDVIVEKLAMLATHPNLGRKCMVESPGLRQFLLSSHVIFYRLEPTHLEVVRILHGARDIETILKPPE